MLFACYELSNKITARFIGALPSRFLVIMNLESMESHKNLNPPPSAYTRTHPLLGIPTNRGVFRDPVETGL